MPGFTERDRYFMGVLNDSKATPEQKAAALYQWQQESEGWNQRRDATSNDGFTGYTDGTVVDAPWRGEFDMPGNFERRQRMANSLAEDARLGAGLSSRYEFDPSQPMDMTIFRTSPAMAANAPELMNNEQAYIMGPPEVSQYGMPGDTRRLNKGKMLTADEVDWIRKMISSGMGDMAQRRYGDNEVFQYLAAGAR